VQVVAGIIVRDGRVLVSRRPAGTHLGGLWEFPGGKLEPGEDEESALVRELREELGIEVRPGASWGILRHRYPEREVVLRFRFAEIVAGEPRPLEVDEVRWATPDELGKLQFPEADRPVVTALVRAGRSGTLLTDIRPPGETP
jgi:8-oxo-dGTP diphosphatase